ncbi:MAG: hypothetical protein LBG57_03920 [Treponema sp.]|jgi:hypothetical protein|nr:hypothetical protein [Treponema sp.]
MGRDTLPGNCYICGGQLSKVAMKNHLIKTCMVEKAGQEALLLKVEGAYDKNYWLYLDIPLTATLGTLDDFLRRIWLECCGHMSGFYYIGQRYDYIGMSKKLKNALSGGKLGYDYDFGTTTELLVSMVAEVRRPSQKRDVRLLARNIPPELVCGKCGKPAEYIDAEAMYEEDNPFFCGECAGNPDYADEDMLLPVTNSPRMGSCAYDGESDVYAFKAVNAKGHVKPA